MLYILDFGLNKTLLFKSEFIESIWIIMQTNNIAKEFRLFLQGNSFQLFSKKFRPEWPKNSAAE